MVFVTFFRDAIKFLSKYKVYRMILSDGKLHYRFSRYRLIRIKRSLGNVSFE